jgi:propionyl-CoA synthetase
LKLQVVGHSYILYAPLLAGATTLQFEGKPIFPDAGIFWRLIQEHKVNVMFTAPTALRAIRQQDPEGKLIKNVGQKDGLKSLRALFLAGERSEPAIVELYAEFLKQHGAPGASVVDNWWSSESGSPITGLAQIGAAGHDINADTNDTPLPPIPGSAGKPMPGFDVRVVDDEGRECDTGKMGNIVLGIPLAPTGFNALWGDEGRFYSSYLKRFNGKWVDTGDSGMIDNGGYVHIMSRSDDIINVAAHRLSTGGIEQAICSHPNVLEACVVGIPDALKGHLPFAFVVLDQSIPDGDDHDAAHERIFAEVQKAVRTQLGGIASLGGMIAGSGMIPKTRSGKTLRRVLRDLVENATEGQFDKEVAVPSTIEDMDVVGIARSKVRDYFEVRGKDKHRSIHAKL